MIARQVLCAGCLLVLLAVPGGSVTAEEMVYFSGERGCWNIIWVQKLLSLTQDCADYEAGESSSTLGCQVALSERDDILTEHCPFILSGSLPVIGNQGEYLLVQDGDEELWTYKP